MTNSRAYGWVSVGCLAVAAMVLTGVAAPQVAHGAERMVLAELFTSGG